MSKIPRNKTTNIYLNGERWQISYCKVPTDVFGDCDYETKTVRVDKELVGEEKLNVIIHELLHARWADFSEPTVKNFADELASIIVNAGFCDEAESD